MIHGLYKYNQMIFHRLLLLFDYFLKNGKKKKKKKGLKLGEVGHVCLELGILIVSNVFCQIAEAFNLGN